MGSLPTQIHGALSGALDASDPDAATASGLPSLTGQLSSEEVMKMSTAANEWMSFFFVTVGVSFIFALSFFPSSLSSLAVADDDFSRSRSW